MQTLNDFNTDNLEEVAAIWVAIMSMDVSLLYYMLDDSIDYEDIGKIKFIQKLTDRFEKHKTLGDSEFYLDLDCCKSCNCEQPVCKFVGNHSQKHFALYFDIQHECIVDIYHCNFYGKYGIQHIF